MQFGGRSSGAQIVPGSYEPLGPLATRCIQAWQAGDTATVDSLVAQVQAEALAPTPQQVAHAARSRAKQVRNAQVARQAAPIQVRLRRVAAVENRAGRERAAQARREAQAQAAQAQAQALRDCPICGEVVDALDVKWHLMRKHEMNLQEAGAAVAVAARGGAFPT